MAGHESRAWLLSLVDTVFFDNGHATASARHFGRSTGLSRTGSRREQHAILSAVFEDDRTIDDGMTTTRGGDGHRSPFVRREQRHRPGGLLG
jgi:hypothetical protein